MPPRPKPEVSESDIEKQIWKWAEENGWWQSKFVAPGLKGVPDRIFFKTIKRGYCRTVLIEVKKPGEEPTPQQQKRARDIRPYGPEVYWVDSLEDAIDILSRS